MVSTPSPMIAQVRQEFEDVLSYLTGPATQTSSAAAVELTLLRRLLAIGAALLQLFLDQRGAQRPTDPVHSPDGTLLRYHDRRARSYYSIFGKLRFRRAAYTAPGQPVVCPVDAALSLPAGCYSALLREWLAFGSTDAAYRETQTLVERILGLRLSVAALETTLAQDAVDLAAFDAQPRTPAGDPRATILVAQADGKGVPIVLDRPAERPVRPSSGRPPNQMKEAIVTALYTIAPYPRTPQQLVDALLDAADPGVVADDPPARPQPVAKQVRATLAGKAAAITDLAARVAQRDGPPIQQRVALTDGAQALQDEVRARLSGFTLVLDLFHVTEYLWAAANARWGARHPERDAWVRTQLTRLLQSQTAQVITTLETAAADPAHSTTQRETLRRVAGYYRRNQPAMDYAAYLTKGWPIGTGVVEGAGGHLVKDRLQQAGMRWTLAGAQAVLDLRAVRVSGEWDADWAFHHHQQQRRLYALPAPSPLPVELHLLDLPAAA